MKLKTLFVFILMFFVIVSCNITNQSNRASNVKSIAWQEDKYLWVSENDKLIRWDTQTKKSETFEGITGELLVDSENTLWVFDSGIISHFNGQEWEYFTPGKELAGGRVLSFLEANGYIWVGTAGLSRYNQQNQSWEILWQIPPGPLPTPIPSDSEAVEFLNEGVYTIAFTSQEAIWFGTSRGLTYWNNTSQQTWTNKELNTDGVRCLLKASGQEVWVCTEDGVGLWDGVQWVEFFDELSEPFLLLPGEDDDVWVITRESGVARWDGISWNRWTENDGLAGQRPTSLLVSTTSGDIWVGTKTGISRWNEKEWRTYTISDGLTSNYVNVLFEDPRGVLWVGTSGGEGLHYYDPNVERWRSLP